MKTITEQEVLKNAREQLVAGLLSIIPDAEFRYKRRWRKSLLVWRAPGETAWRGWRIYFYDLSAGVLRLTDCYAPDFLPGSGERGIRNDREFTHAPDETRAVAEVMASETLGIPAMAAVNWGDVIGRGINHTTNPYRWTVAADTAYQNCRARKER